jgi:hypothetical protein
LPLVGHMSCLAEGDIPTDLKWGSVQSISLVLRCRTTSNRIADAMLYCQRRVWKRIGCLKGKLAFMNGTALRQLNAEDAPEYQAVFLGALRSAPIAFRRELWRTVTAQLRPNRGAVSTGGQLWSICGRTLVCNRHIVAASLCKAAACRNDMEHVRIGETKRTRTRRYGGPGLHCRR